MAAIPTMQPDITLLLDMDGVIREATLSPAMRGESVDGWLGRPWVEIAGDKVTRGQTLVVLEAMKIQHQLKAALDARIESVAVQEGQQVSNRTVLVTMAAGDGAADAAAH